MTLRNRSRSPRAQLALGGLLSLGLPLCAQSAPQAAAQAVPSHGAPPVAVWRASHGLSALDGALWAQGPDYRARFDARGLEFTPAFGKRAPKSYPTRFELLAWQRAEGPQQLAQPDEPAIEGQTAVYERGAGVEEHYEARRDGLEQSFEFAAPPAGSGDLVVRLAVHSELGRAGDARGLALEAPGLGALTIGAVTGIDASGARAAGALRWSGAELELVLPAAFVDSAHYPLLLDPLLGVEFEVDSDPTNLYDDVSPAIAHDTTTGSYLIVWTRAFSISDMDIRGQRVSDAGALLGSLIGIEAGTTISPLATSPAVGNCNLTNAWLVAWESSASIFSTRDLIGRSVFASSGTVSTGTVTIAASAANDDDPAIGGEAQTVDDEVLVTWSESGAGIRARQVTVPSASNPFLTGLELDVSDATTTSWEDVQPAISKGTGYGGNFVIAWQRYFGLAATPYYDVRYALVDRNATLLVGTSALTSSTTTSETNIAVAGDGVKFAVVYEQEAVSGGNPGIYGNRIAYLGGASAPHGPQVTIADSVFPESDPDIVDTQDSMVLAYIGTNILSSNSPIVVQALDPIDLAPCGASVAFSDSVLDYDFPALSSAAESTTNADGDVLAVVQGRDTSSSGGEIWAQRYAPIVGLNTEITGSCGGRTEMGCQLSTETEVKTHVVEAPVGLPSWVIVSPQPLDMPFGACTLWADPFHGWIQSSGVTDALGEAHLSIAISPTPGLAGLQFHAQHVLQGVGGPVSFTSGGPSFYLSTSVLATFE